MRRPIALSQLAVVLALSAVCATAGASSAQISSCEVESEYDLTLNERSLILTRAAGTPKALVMRQGALFVDDRWVELSAADRDRIARFEQGARAAMPIAQAVGREAAAIAFTALGEVAAGFSSDPTALQAKLAKARVQLDARLARSVSATNFNGNDLGSGISAAVGEVIPSLIGDIVGGAISAAFSGDASRLERMENLDAQIEAKVEPRAAALERRAESLCTRLVELDRLDNALEFRLADGGALDLIDATHKPARPPATAPDGR